MDQPASYRETSRWRADRLRAREQRTDLDRVSLVEEVETVEHLPKGAKGGSKVSDGVRERLSRQELTYLEACTNLSSERA